MDDTTNHLRGVSRRTFLTASAAIGVGATLGTGAAGLAWAAPDCGNKNDSGARFYLWEQVDGKTDQTPAGTNIDVVRPKVQPDPSRVQYYAVRKGGDVPGSSNDLLVLPTNRISGIECSYLWQSTQQNLWRHAWAEAAARVKPAADSAIALGVNSKNARSQDQLHIHLTTVHRDTLADLRKSNVPTDLNQWMSSVVTLRVNDRDKKHKQPKDVRTDADFRVVKYTGSLPNLFTELKRRLPAGEAMETQMIGVVYTGMPKTYYVLNSSSRIHDGTGAADYIFGWPLKP